MHTSGLLFLFWFFLMVCGIPQFRTEIRASQDDNVDPEFYGSHLTYLLYFMCVVVIFLLNCLSDKLPRETQYEKQEVRHIIYQISEMSELLLHLMNLLYNSNELMCY